jgi:SAM-dependent methyltransferase
VSAERDAGNDHVDLRAAIVRAGYDAMADAYLAWNRRVSGDPRDRFLDELVLRLEPEARVLDLGCGAGVPSTRTLAERFDVVGLDASDAQIRRARANVPQASFRRVDMLEASFPAASFDAVTAFYSISHVPREQHGDLFQRVASWLKPNGHLLAVLGSGDLPDWTGDWLGVPMFFSSYGPDENRRLLAAAGFLLVVDEIVSMQEPDGAVSFQWVIARKR